MSRSYPEHCELFGHVFGFSVAYDEEIFEKKKMQFGPSHEAVVEQRSFIYFLLKKFHMIKWEQCCHSSKNL